MKHLEASDIWIDGELRRVVTVLVAELDALERSDGIHLDALAESEQLRQAAETVMAQMAEALSYGYNHAHYNYETAKYFSDAMAAYRVWKGGV